MQGIFQAVYILIHFDFGNMQMIIWSLVMQIFMEQRDNIATHIKIKANVGQENNQSAFIIAACHTKYQIILLIK